MTVHELTSPHNAKYRRWLSLLESKGIRKEGQALVSGEKLVRELFAARSELITEFILPPKREWDFAIPSSYRVSAAMFKALDVLGTGDPLAVVTLPKIEEFISRPPVGLELVLALQDPANLGALLRSAEAFGVRHVILARECASPYLPKAIKAAAGSTFRLTYSHTGALASWSAGPALGLDLNGTDLRDFNWPQDAFLILGEEGPGLPANLKAHRVSIPMAGDVESLNATVAASIALFMSSSRKRH